MASKKLMQKIVSPAKIASALEWNRLGGTVLSLDIHKKHIGMALSSHPSMEQSPKVLESLHFGLHGGKLPKSTKKTLENIVDENNVCGIIVSWPVQKDTGHLGAGCGTTLHIMEELADETDILKHRRPVCLWDSEHTKPMQRDKWGRCSDYSRVSHKDTHLASVEQYAQGDDVEAASVWDDFAHIHWPNLKSSSTHR